MYNGWTNYETWCVNLYLTNDLNLVEELDSVLSDYNAAYDMHELIDWLKETLEHHFGDPFDKLGHGVYLDLIHTALDACNWQEIAESLMDDMVKNYPDYYQLIAHCGYKYASIEYYENQD